MLHFCCSFMHSSLSKTYYLTSSTPCAWDRHIFRQTRSLFTCRDANNKKSENQIISGNQKSVLKKNLKSNVIKNCREVLFWRTLWTVFLKEHQSVNINEEKKSSRQSFRVLETICKDPEAKVSSIHSGIKWLQLVQQTVHFI